MLSVFRRKRWISFERAIKPYDNFFSVDYGISWVNPQDIIGLSLNPRKVKNGEKTKQLRDSVALNGWTNQSPFTLHLYRLPNGKFTVGNGGNHRAYLSNKLKIPRIRALVTIVIPANLISEEQRSQLEDFALKEREFDLKAKEVNDFLITKGVFRDKYKAGETLFDEYCELATLQDKHRKDLLLEIAKKLEYIPVWKDV